MPAQCQAWGKQWDQEWMLGCSCPYCSLPSSPLGGPWNFAFTVKFYPPDPAQLTEDITR